MVKVCLINMPYATIKQPSIALGLLKAGTTKVGIDTQVVYANLRFAEIIGLDAYQTIAHLGTGELLGEWTFSGAAFPNFNPDHSAYLDEVLKRSSNMNFLKKVFWEIREKANLFIDHMAKEVLKDNPHVVGCTSTFQQHCASLALLRRIRELDDSVITIIGGANCEGSLGLTTYRVFPWVDFVISGEADDFFPGFIRLLLESGKEVDPAKLPYGVIGSSRQGSFIKNGPPRACVYDLDSTPVPNYDEYFNALNQSSLFPYISPGLPIETSRGCWWGQKHQCAFCGLNGAAISYRTKSPYRILEEFRTLSKRYSLEKFEAVDNVLNMAYIQELFPQLAKEKPSYSIFYETRANFTYEQLAQLAKAGVQWIQVGIESMHDSILKMLNKGTSTLQNIQLLRMARELGIRVAWNFLWGIPGEKDQWYAEVTHWLPFITHLEPPRTVVKIRYDRFSAYHKRPEDFELHLSPRRAYHYIYPFDPDLLADLAYFFEDYEDITYGHFERHGLKALIIGVIKWCQLFYSSKSEEIPRLYAFDYGDRAFIFDTRPCKVETFSIISGLACRILRLCNHPQTRQTIVQALQSDGEFMEPLEDVWKIIEQLSTKKLLLELNGKFLNLTIKGLPPEVLNFNKFPGGFVRSSMELQTMFIQTKI